MTHTHLTAQNIDDVLAGTFPASDPPAWTPGMARPAPEIAMRETKAGSAQDETQDGRAHRGAHTMSDGEVPLTPG